MPWLTRARPDEKGIVVVFMAAAVVVLVGMAALVIDVGAIRDERRQLQNGADAAALAVAQRCALAPCGALGIPTPASVALATELAGANAQDGKSAVTVSFPSPNQVEVITNTDGGSGAILPYSFGQVLTGQKGTTVRAKATAAWGFAGQARVVRLAISRCDVVRLGFNPAPQAITFQRSPACTAGRDNAGGFGWLDRDSASLCELTLSAGGTPSVDPGASEPSECLAPYMGKDVLLPVFDDVIGITGTGTNAKYTIEGFARFHLTGYSFPGRISDPAPLVCARSNCITGYFVRYVAPSQVVGGADFGVSSVKLVS